MTTQIGDSRWTTILTIVALFAVFPALSGCSQSSSAETVYDPYRIDSYEFDTIQFVEIDLGVYGLTFLPPNRRTSHLINFHIYGVVPESHQQDFTERLELYRERMRDEVRQTVLSNDLSVLNASSQLLLKSDLVKTVRRALGTDMIKEVVFSDLSIQ